MNFSQFFIGLILPVLLLSPNRLRAEETSGTLAPGEIPVNEMLLTEDADIGPEVNTEPEKKAAETLNTLAPGEIPVNEMLLTEDADIEPEIDTEADEETELTDQPQEENRPFFSFLDSHQRFISNRLQQYVIGVDNFFTDNTAANKSTGSHIRLSLESTWPEGRGADFRAGISLRLRLPKTQKKLKLIISSNIDEQRNSLDRETGKTSSTDSGEKKSFYTGLEGKIKKTGNWRIRPSIGLKLHSPLDWYVRLRANRDITFEKWLMSFTETLYWFGSTGFGYDTTVRWDRLLNNALLFRSNSFLRYTDEFDYYEMSQTFSLTHELSKKRAITYKIGVFGINEPSTHATTYLVNVLYRSKIHKDYMFLDIQPQILFEQENDFKGSVELLMRLQIFYRG